MCVCVICRSLVLAAFGILGIVFTGKGLVHNEFSNAKFTAMVDYIEGHTVEAGCRAADSLNEKLIHLTCPVTRLPNLSAKLAFIRPLLINPNVNGTEIRWDIEMYQWRSYHKQGRYFWRQEWHGLENIESPETSSDHMHINPLPPRNLNEYDELFSNVNPKFWIGDPKRPFDGYRLSESLKEQSSREDYAALFSSVKAKTQYNISCVQSGYLHTDNFFTCSNNTISTEPCQGNPRIGGIRIRLKRFAPKMVSVIAKQASTTRTRRPDHAESDGSDFPVATLRTYDIDEWLTSAYDAAVLFDGTYSLAEMVNSLRSRGDVRVWVYRIMGWLAMSFFVAIVFHAAFVSSLSFQGVLFMVPVLGGCARDCAYCVFGVGLVISAIINLPICIVIIALAWIWARPLFTIALLISAALIMTLLYYLSRRVRSRQATMPDETPQNPGSLKQPSDQAFSQQNNNMKPWQYNSLTIEEPTLQKGLQDNFITVEDNLVEP